MLDLAALLITITLGTTEVRPLPWSNVPEFQDWPDTVEHFICAVIPSGPYFCPPERGDDNEYDGDDDIVTA
jgi:hypothetical protein